MADTLLVCVNVEVVKNVVSSVNRLVNFVGPAANTEDALCATGFMSRLPVVCTRV